MLFYRPINSKGETSEPPEIAHDRNCCNTKYYPLVTLSKTSVGKEEVVEKVGEHNNGEVQRRELPKPNDTSVNNLHL